MNLQNSITHKLKELTPSLRGRVGVGLVIACALLGSCKSKQTIVKERYAVHDTVWSVRNDRTAQRDSIVYYEFTDVRPHVLRLSDTTIVYTDTVVQRVTDSHRFNFVYQYRDTGSVRHDTVKVEKEVPVTKAVKQTVTKRNGFSWKTLFAGMAIGIVLSLLWKHRKGIISVVKRLLKRTV